MVQIFKEFFSVAPLKSEFNSDIKLIKDPLNCVLMFKIRWNVYLELIFNLPGALNLVF